MASVITFPLGFKNNVYNATFLSYFCLFCSNKLDMLFVIIPCNSFRDYGPYMTIIFLLGNLANDG